VSIDGFFAVDKLSGITSRKVAVRVGQIFKCKAGHCGTLDPLATGVLLVCVGRARLLSRFLSALDKRYRVTAVFGTVTDTYDVTGRVVRQRDSSGLTSDEVEEALERLTGEILQVPPPFSAVKSGGKPLYTYARRGVAVKLPERKVNIDAIRLIDFRHENSKAIAELEVSCSKGTYIRSLVNDLGEILGHGACVLALRRTSVGKFGEERLIPYELVRLGAKDELIGRLIGIEEATYFLPSSRVNPDGEKAVNFGKPLDASMIAEICGIERVSGNVRVLNEAGKVIAIYGPPKEGDPENIVARAVRVLKTDS